MSAFGDASAFAEPLDRVMPTIFVAGPAKSGSTFLWECLQATFHPERVCGRGVQQWADAACGSGAAARFVLPALGGDVSEPACLHFNKESAFWRYWGRRKQHTWVRYGGPQLPLGQWEQGPCRARHGGRGGGAARGPGRAGSGPRALAAHRQMEDRCMEAAPCAAPTPYDTELPDACHSTCTPCRHHPGWQDNFDAPCPIAPYRCRSPVCADAPYVPKAVRRRLNYSGHHKRAFSLTAFASWAELAAANVSRSRVASVEGNPGIFQTPPRHALALRALATAAGRARLRLIVGLRDPFDLAFSLWSFLSSIGQEGRRVEHRFGRALDALLGCNATLGARPALLLGLPPSHLDGYRQCLDERKTSRQHFYVYGGLYALHLLGWLRLGYTGEQFLFVRMTSLPRDAPSARALQAELGAFLGLPPPAARARGGKGLCLQPTMTTKKSWRVKAHNASVRDVKRAFRASPAAARAHTFLDAHDALLRRLFDTHRVRVY